MINIISIIIYNSVTNDNILIFDNIEILIVFLVL